MSDVATACIAAVTVAGNHAGVCTHVPTQKVSGRRQPPYVAVYFNSPGEARRFNAAVIEALRAVREAVEEQTA